MSIELKFWTDASKMNTIHVATHFKNLGNQKKLSFQFHIAFLSHDQENKKAHKYNKNKNIFNIFTALSQFKNNHVHKILHYRTLHSISLLLKHQLCHGQMEFLTSTKTLFHLMIVRYRFEKPSVEWRVERVSARSHTP